MVPAADHALAAAGYVPADPAVRRTALRQLAALVDDTDPNLITRLVRQLAAPGLSTADRNDAWEQLTEAVALLDAVGAGQVEPCSIVPGARPSEAYTIAADVLEQDISSALDVLYEDPRGDSACPECPTGTVHSVGRPEWETGHQSYACDAGCGYAG